MKAFITGAAGFIASNLAVALRRSGFDIAGADIDTPRAEWVAGARGAGVVYHLAGVNRPERDEDFEAGNVGSLEALLAAIDEAAGSAPDAARPVIVLSSSTQAGLDNPYGRSKLAAERMLEAYAARTGSPAAIYRLPGVFGKWCRPDYNSVVATFCHNVARGLPITVSDPSRVIELVHVGDVVARFAAHLETRHGGVIYGGVDPVFQVSLGDLASRIRGFRAMRETLETADASDPLTGRLLGTYTSYIPPPDLAYALVRRSDPRGTLAEVLKSPRFGQLFVSRTQPGVTRGNHYHDLKVEKFCVLEGDAVIRFRPILAGEVTEHHVSGTDFVVVDIPPGTTHSIENIGPGELIVLFWASEILDHDHPDTHSCEVLRA